MSTSQHKRPSLAPIEEIALCVEVERRPGITRWQRFVWRPCALRPGHENLAPWTLLARDGEHERYFAGNATVVLHRADTQVLKDNLESRTPSIYVVLRKAAPGANWTLLLVTADPSAAHAHADVGGDLVEALPMPEAIQCRLSAFIARRHVERPYWKRHRDIADPGALGARRREGVHHAKS